MELWPNPRRFLSDVAEYATPLTDLLRFTMIPFPFTISTPLCIVSVPVPLQSVGSPAHQKNFMITVKQAICFLDQPVHKRHKVQGVRILDQ